MSNEPQPAGAPPSTSGSTAPLTAPVGQQRPSNEAVAAAAAAAVRQQQQFGSSSAAAAAAVQSDQPARMCV
jgi:hypothetical protein